MTEYEIRESLASIYAQVSQDSAMCFTLISAFLVVAYVSGSKLSTLQVSIVNALFGGWVGILIFSIHENMLNAADLNIRFDDAGFSSRANPDTTMLIAYGYPLMLFVGLLAAYYFMWNVRHPRHR